MRVLLFAGAGTSVELGVPGMVGLGDEFLDHAQRWDIVPSMVEQLIGEDHDIEHLIEELDQICSARPTLEALGTTSQAIDNADQIRAEIEWFVQHAAERVVPRDARLMWSAVLRASSSVDLTLVTTNYDRAIELAANAEGIRLNDGFGSFGHAEIAPWGGFNADDESTKLVKLHGSTDWYSSGRFSSPKKLRHPMPLFGRSTLRLGDGTELGSALVLPSREKLLTHNPYPRLSQAFLNAADRCDVAIFVGTSLRDHHIRNAAEETSRKVPVFLVNRSGEAHGLEAVHTIESVASTFLIATLPNALLAGDPIGFLESATGTSVNEGGAALPLLKQALDAGASQRLRCEALEQLDELANAPDPYWIRQLLSGPDTTVARYALGLIAHSSLSARLISEAESSEHASKPDFAEDLNLLRRMLDS